MHNLTDQIIVRFSDPYADGELKANGLSAQIGKHLEFVRETALGSKIYKLPSKESLPQVKGYVRALMATSGVEYAEADQMMFAIATLQDPPSEGVLISDGSPVYNLQWHYFESTGGMDAPGAWAQLDSADNPVRVAVLDTGYTNHPDLDANIDASSGRDMVHDTYISNDGDGRDNDARDPGDWSSRNYCYLGSPSYDSSWHGTHVAGTISAVTNNSSGVAGIGYNLIKVIPVRVLGQCGGYSSDIADGIRWAAGLEVDGETLANPAQVINMSLGGSGACAADSEYQLAINAAVAQGTTVVVAAGNSNTDAANFTPASCANVVSVAATGRTGARAYYSNYGSVVDLAAPGGDMSSGSSDGVLSTMNSGVTDPSDPSYAYYQGTSMATPHTAAVAALLYNVNSTIVPAEVEAVLKDSARRFAGTCNGCGAGILSAGSALNLASGGSIQPVPTVPDAPSDIVVLPGDGSAVISWRDNSDNETAFVIERSKENKRNRWSGFTEIGTTAANFYDDSGLDGTYIYRVRARNEAGDSTYAESELVTVTGSSSGSGDGSGSCKGNGPKCR
ncbi:S8 family serine peptidase [Marinobacterium sp. D7]|uniref:S8 family serine peptidase n=1 Tax=Marinobacterium ramblicola TaxID=2849041 RepID=UPI001C2D3803|nr:S8 family serine peptidase [Marinobacterium ramblicola]MBV1789693.1 S8 family serine peptidase [Marinobacterium ramblicola]